MPSSLVCSRPSCSSSCTLRSSWAHISCNASRAFLRNVLRMLASASEGRGIYARGVGVSIAIAHLAAQVVGIGARDHRRDDRSRRGLPDQTDEPVELRAPPPTP